MLQIFNIFLVLAILVFNGCSGMIRSLQQESDEADRPNGNAPKQASYREEPTYQPRTLRGLSANNNHSYDPPVQRAYNRAPASAPTGDGDDGGEGYGGNQAPRNSGNLSSTRRMTRSDFVDGNEKENSLWDAQGQDNYLFTHNDRRELGDVVSVDVERDLKREIQYALWMNLPPEQRRVKKSSANRGVASTTKDKDPKKNPTEKDAKAAVADAGKSETEKNKDAAEEAAKTNMESGDDNVRMEVVAQESGGMVRLLGQKRVIYRGVSRVVEIVALAKGRDIDETGRVKSSNFIDTKTQVIQ